MQILSQVVAPIVIGLICFTLSSAKPHGKKYRHHVKSRDHLEDEWYKPDYSKSHSKKDSWKSPQWMSWDPSKDDVDKSDKSTDYKDKLDSFDLKDSEAKKDWKSSKFDFDPLDKEKDTGLHTKGFDESFDTDQKYKSRDGDEPIEDKKDHKDSFYEEDFKKPYYPAEKPANPAAVDDPKKDSKTDYWGKKEVSKSDFINTQDKKSLNEKAESKDDGKQKFDSWPIGDDTDKLPQPTTAATKLHPLKLSKPLIKCKSEMDCPMSRVCKDGYCHCAEKTYCAGHSSPVCGSDGILYPSHCELHRTACLKTIHIKIDHKGLCFEKEKGTDSVGYLPMGTSDEKSKDAVGKVVDFDVKDTDKKDFEVKDKEEFKDTKELDIKYIDDIKDGKSIKDSDVEDKTKSLEDSYKHKDEKKESSEEVHKKGYEDDKFQKEDKVDKEDKIDSDDYKQEPFDKAIKFDESKEYYDDYDDDEFDNKKTLSDVKEKLEKDEKQFPPVVVCSEGEYRKFKDQLLRYHCAKFEEPDCESEILEKRKFLASIMFSYYDRNFDDYLEKDELQQIEMNEHFEKLSASCILMDILRLEDSAKDGKLSIDEFFEAFTLDKSVLDERVKILSVLATVGHGLELTCGITGVKDVIWKRHGVDVNALHMDDISAFEDGTLYISHVAVHHMGNFSCHDRNNPDVVQTHMIKVQMSPQVKVMPGSQLHRSHTDVTLKCHAEGVPMPKVTWEINEVQIPDDHKHFERRNDNHTLVIHDTDYQTDTGAYKCRASNMAGVAQDIATVFIQNYNTTHLNPEINNADNMFIVFHNKGYDIYEPQHCLVRHEVNGDFTNMKYFPEIMDSVQSLCNDRECDWGTAINVANKFVYASQPAMNRVVIIDVTQQWNPVQLVDTDKEPVRLHYVPHLDQVWVLCWNGGRDSGSKTMVVIRDASKSQRHQIVHTQPVGNRFDLIRDMFLPPGNDLGHHFEFGYVVHTGQRGLYKLELEEMKYIKAIDFNKHNCHPKYVVFVPLGGMIVIQCQAETIDATHHFQIVVDYLSDIVLSNSTLRGIPYISPDSRYLITVDSITGEVDVQSVTDEGVLKKEYSVSTGTPITEVAFHPSDSHRGYNLYLTSRTKGVVYYMDLKTGNLMNVDGIEERVQDSWLWDGMNHALVGSGLFGDYLLTTTDSSAIIINGKLQKVECEFRDLKNSHVVVWVQPETL